MTKQDWIKHIESKHGIIRPTLGGNVQQWQSIAKQCLDNGCVECKARARTKKATRNARETRQAYKDLGYKRVVGADGGVYYE